jgi:hypothetical protein
VEPHEVADQIQEAMAEEQAERREADQFRTQAAITIATLAMLLAIASLGGENATKEMINSNVFVTNEWAFYQAKNVRQTANQLAANELEDQLVLHGAGLSAADRQALQQRIDQYRSTVVRYENEPDPNDPTNPLKGDGKTQIMNRAHEYEEKRAHALDQDPNFDYSTALFQIAIVLGSVSIVSMRRPILWLAVLLGTLATVLMLNGFFLFFHLPSG